MFKYHPNELPSQIQDVLRSLPDWSEKNVVFFFPDRYGRVYLTTTLIIQAVKKETNPYFATRTCFAKFYSHQKRWELVLTIRTCRFETDENGTGLHLQKCIFRAFKGLLWPYSMHKMGEVLRIPKIPSDSFLPNATKICFDKLVLICCGGVSL